MKKINVAVAVIVNSQQQILLALRHQHLHQGGKWEFPGGKIETGETAQQAIIREINEEVSLSTQSTVPMMVLEHDYGDKLVCLHVHWVKEFSGDATGAEGQEIKWVDVSELSGFEFPAANKPILEAVINNLS
ncbi:MAG: 7,8-dihydro-8-oxoguanine-triphosphatase [Gammaproteobacteria bacterium MedPE]|nr:MAG: 7,8-dihydro-8-oxoguanine-triphosphatase [Gammaproteobacteria bacterium MedPE]